MSVNSLLSELLARPAPAQRASSLLDAVLWRLLLGLAILFLFLALWRVLEMTLGPILAPLSMALALALTAGVLAYTESRRKRRLKAQTPPLAPLIGTVLEIAFAPKIVRWFALGSLLYDTFVTGTSPLAGAMGSKRRRNRGL